MVYKSKTRTIKNKNIFKSQKGGEGELPENNVPPTLRDNIKKFADIWLQSFNNLSMYTLDKIEDKIKDVSIKWGVNPNSSIKTEIKKVSQKAEEITAALDTPQGKKALTNLTNLFNRITKNVIIPSSRKLTEQLIENLQPIMIKGQNAVFALLSASPFGAIIDIPRFVSESLGVIEKSVTLADDVLDIGIDTVDQIKTEKGAFDSVLSEFDSLTESANAKISSGLDSVKSTVDNYGKGIMSSDMKTGLTNSMDGMKTGLTNSMDGMKTGLTNSMDGMKTGLTSGLNDVNKSFQQYKKESTMIGGRVKNAYSEFVSPIINSQQMIKQYGGTRKRRVSKRNRFSRRY
jgi:hypothetical protein